MEGKLVQAKRFRGLPKLHLASAAKDLLDIHAGICGHHTTLRALVNKAFQHGFYWPTTLDNTKVIVKAC